MSDLYGRIKGQCYCLGQLFAVLSSQLKNGPTVAERDNAQLYPLYGVTLMLIKVHKLHLSDESLERVLAKLYSDISADDWLEYNGGKLKAVPLDCQMEWCRGFWSMAKDDDGKVGTLLALYRRQKKLNQTELAEKIGVTQKTVSTWEIGAYRPDRENIKKLAKILECPIEDLL